MNVEYKDYYKILEVPRDASLADIKKSFRTLARRYHPDRARDNPNAEEKFKEINEAYEVLGDPEKRKKYDALGANWRAGESFRPPPGWSGGEDTFRGFRTGDGSFEYHFGGTGFSDFFEELFGAGGAFQRAEHHRGMRDRKGGDFEADIMVTLDEALKGSTRRISLERANATTGAAETVTLAAKIPPGVREGQRIRIAGQGQAGTGAGMAGDLYLRVRLAAHPDFRVHGSNLYYDLDLMPWEAALGATRTVPSLDGPIRLKIPPGTHAGKRLRIPHRGLPRGKGERGDLFAVTSIQIPEKLTPANERAWKQLADSYGKGTTG